MPSNTKLRTERSTAAGDKHNKLEMKKGSRQYPGSKLQQEKALSPRTSQSLRFKDSVRTVSRIHPPHVDRPLEIAKDANKGLYVRSKDGDFQKQQNTVFTESKEDELVKYMSKLPSYLKTGEKLQDNVLNFGVLDWDRLEKWKQKQNKVSGRDGSSSVSIGTSYSKSTSTSSSSSQSRSLKKVDSGVARPPKGKVTKHQQHPGEQGLSCRQPEFFGNASGINKVPKIREKASYQKSKLAPRTSSPPVKYEIPTSSKEKIPDSDDRLEDDRAAKGKGLETQAASQHSHCKRDNIILLLPKDFSRPSSSEISRRTSLDGTSAELDWNSFSDVFSIEEIQSQDPFLDIPYSCPLTYTAESETDLDMKLDDLIDCQSSDLECDLPCLSPKLDVNKSGNKDDLADTPKGSEQGSDGSLNPERRDSSRRFSFGMRRLARSLSFRESSALPHMSSTYVSAKSGPVMTDVSSSFHCPGNNIANSNGKSRNSPFRRLLDPLLKHRASKISSSAQSIQSCPDNLDDFNIGPGSALEALFHDKSSVSTTKAILQLTVKGVLPLFKFLVETNNEILASTVKQLSTFGKDDPNWLYTFYSVHKVRRKSNSWKSRLSKDKKADKNAGFFYTIVGQMKVSNPQSPVEQDLVMKPAAMESVLYGVDLNKTDEPTTEFTRSKELAAVVVKLPSDCSSTRNNLSSGGFDNVDEKESSSSVVVILPSGVHGLPTEGIPAPLISRWKSGGLCDCGGWDVGCRLRILASEPSKDKTFGLSRLSSLRDRFDLFIQGATNQTKSRPIFSLFSHGNGVFSVEYDAAISSLQAFSICVAFVNSQKATGSMERFHSDSGQEPGSLKTPVDILGDGPAKFAAYPPHSPVGRV